MDFNIYPPLTKDYILDRIDQETIMEKYLGVPVVFDTLIISPSIIRTDDTNPSFGFKYNANGKLRCKDFNGSFWGDCFDVVAKAINVNSSNSKGFQMVLHTIAKDFRIHKYVNINEVNNYKNLTANFFKKKRVSFKKIYRIIPREINYHDVAYWKRFNVSPQILNKGRVYFAQEIQIRDINSEFGLLYVYSPKDPAYCYYGGKDSSGIDEWKIYYPFRTKQDVRPRFHSNSSFLQGKHLITCDRVGIITKAYKDVLSFRSFNLQAVAPSAESTLISNDDYWFMRSKFDYLVSCMDFDRTGLRMAIQLWRTYKITPIMFSNGYYNTTNYGVKDFAEHVDKYGTENTISLLLSIYNKYRKDFEQLDTYYFNSLKFIK